jgi:hypothetical protein
LIHSFSWQVFQAISQQQVKDYVPFSWVSLIQVGHTVTRTPAHEVTVEQRHKSKVHKVTWTQGHRCHRHLGSQRYMDTGIQSHTATVPQRHKIPGMHVHRAKGHMVTATRSNRVSGLNVGVRGHGVTRDPGSPRQRVTWKQGPQDHRAMGPQITGPQGHSHRATGQQSHMDTGSHDHHRAGVHSCHCIRWGGLLFVI